jgi:ABC-type nickel/cobalt efflux system permease component RcnA
MCTLESGEAGNPLRAPSASQQFSTRSAQPSFLTRIAIYQQQLKMQMAGLIRQIQSGQALGSGLFLMLIAYAYGLVHAAGPGHGKAIAMSFILSRRPSLAAGLLFSILTALFHGLSGILCVLGLYFVLQHSISGTLTTVNVVTQVVSFCLIILLGIGLCIMHLRSFLSRRGKGSPFAQILQETRYRGFVPWALAVGLVPCPGVVMIMLFCLSMEALSLGLIMGLCISLGMATTIGLFVTAVVLGKAGLLKTIPEKYLAGIEGLVGVVSGLLISILGTFFLLAALHSPGT